MSRVTFGVQRSISVSTRYVSYSRLLYLSIGVCFLPGKSRFRRSGLRVCPWACWTVPAERWPTRKCCSFGSESISHKFSSHAFCSHRLRSVLPFGIWTLSTAWPSRTSSLSVCRPGPVGWPSTSCRCSGRSCWSCICGGGGTEKKKNDHGSIHGRSAWYYFIASLRASELQVLNKLYIM